MSKTSHNISTFGGLYRQLLNHKVSVIQAILLQLLWILFELVFPFLTQALVDQGINQNDIEFIYLLLIGQAALFFGILMSDVLRFWLLRHLGIRVNMKLVNFYFSSLLHKSYLYFSNITQGELLQHVNDNFRVENFMTMSSVNFISSVFKMIAFGIVLFVFSWKIGVIFFISFVIIVIWITIFLNYRKNIDNDRFRVGAMMRSELMEVQEGVIDIKVNGLEHSKVIDWHIVQDVSIR